jgi:hypothetical protein
MMRCDWKRRRTHVVEQVLKNARKILWANLPPTHSLSDEAALRALRKIMRSPAVWTARERGSDNVLTFILRGANRILSEQSQAAQEIISRLWDILIQPDLARQVKS